MFLCTVPVMPQPRSPPVPTGAAEAAATSGRVWCGARAGREQRTEGRTDRRTGGDFASVRPHQETQHRRDAAGGTQRLRCPLLRRGYKTCRKRPKTAPNPSNPPGDSEGPVCGAMAELPEGTEGTEASDATELTELEAAIERIVTVFVTFAAKEGRKGTLSTGEFKELVRLQLPNMMKDVPSLEEKMSELDVNNDEELRFGEFWRLIGELAKAVRRDKAAKK
ncbi:protein S100-A13 isoform X1 [Agelaius tricolor]